ncbi:putative reverse transcriptase domain-containing protein [Tanacetum coccineum]
MTAPTSRYEVGQSSTAAPRPTGGHRADYGFIGTTDSEIRRQRAEEVGYGIRDVWVDPTEAVEEVALMTLEGVNARVTELASVQEQDTQDIYAMIEDTQDRQTQFHHYRDSCQRHWDRFRHFSLEIRLMQMIPRVLNNMPPRRSSATARADVVAAAAATPITAAAVEQLIEAIGIEGVVVLSQWFEKMELVFHISNCFVENQVNFATCTFLGNALTWWNSHMKTVTQDVAYAMDWKALKKMMTLALMCGRMFHEESKEVEKYVAGLPDMIRGNVMSYQPKTMEKEIEFANDQMDQKVLTITERQAEHKKKCNKCKKIGHMARDYRSSGPNGNNNNRGNFKTTQNAVTCYEYGVQGHFKKDCLKLKNGNRGNQCGNGNASAKVYVVGNAGTNPKSNIVTELGSFDVIIGMDMLSKYHALIDCAEKIVRIPWGNETLIVHGDRSNQGNGTRLNLILCTKTHKYLLKGHNVFLAHVTTKETEDKSGEKQLEDVPTVRDFPKVFPKDLSGLPPTLQVEF